MTTKLPQSGVAFVLGFILLAAGWVPELAATQAAGTVQAMRWTSAMGTVFLALSACVLLRFYRLHEVRKVRPCRHDRDGTRGFS